MRTRKKKQHDAPVNGGELEVGTLVSVVDWPSTAGQVFSVLSTEERTRGRGLVVHVRDENRQQRSFPIAHVRLATSKRQRRRAALRLGGAR